MRVLFTGSRKWTDSDAIYERLLDLAADYGDDLEVAHGASHGGGVDAFVAEHAEALNIKQWPFPVRPDLDGRHRGAPINRNKRMVAGFMPDLVIGYIVPGPDNSNGTRRTLAYAESLGYPTETNEGEPV